MNWIYGFLAALAIFGPMFAMVWKEDKPDEEDAKTLLGALD